MKVTTGVDIVHIPSFTTTKRVGGSSFVKRCFFDSELQLAANEASLAGFFAAKEAVIKALGLPGGSWLDVRLTKLESGKPSVEVLTPLVDVSSCDISISHDQEYVVATCVAVQ
jgi:holo-[acyl-carrier protein] synthase